VEKFDSLHIVPEILAKKTLYVSLKQLPSLMRRLLIRGNYLPFLNEHNGHENSHSKWPANSRRKVEVWILPLITVS
jgi:hypothetical protein